MQIVDIAARPLRACFVLPAGTVNISVSTIFEMPSLAVFDRKTGVEITLSVLGNRNPYPNAENIAGAIAHGMREEASD